MRQRKLVCAPVRQYSGCRDAHGENRPHDFHHDNGRDKGSVFAFYRPTIPASGCWSIEEFHPGGSIVCSRHLSSTVPVDISTSFGVRRVFVDQSSRGNQWNHLGIFEVLQQ